MPKPIYLESADSVRAAWDSNDVDAARAHLFIEALMAVSFGRQLVIPQSFAPDSLAAQETIRDLAAAFATARQGAELEVRRPILLHLHGTADFREALATVLARAGQASPEQRNGAPFHSSLYPELNGLSLHEAADMAQKVRDHGPLTPFLEKVGPERKALFDAVWDYLSPAKRGEGVITPRPRGHFLALGQLMEPLLDDGSQLMTRLKSDGLWDVDSIRTSVEAVRTLERHGGRAQFNDRSRLRDPWTWASSGATARDLIGPAAHRRVCEIVDTLYNRVVADSIGVATESLYSTPLAARKVALDDFKVQELALMSASEARGLDLASSPITRDEGRQLPEVTISVEDGDAANAFFALAGSRREAAFAAVLTAAATKDWKTSLAEIALRRQAGNPARVEEAVAQHLQRVALTLRPVLGAGQRTDGSDWKLMELGVALLTSGGGAGVGVATANASWALVVAAAGGLGAGGVALTRLGHRYLATRGQPTVHKTTHALSQFVSVQGGNT